MEFINRDRNSNESKEGTMPQASCRDLSKSGTELAIKKFGDEQTLLIKACPDSQPRMCRHSETCFFGEYPTLNDLSNAFAKNTPVVWLIPQLHDLSEYCGCKEKLVGRSLRQCAEMIAYNFGYLKVTEVMLFFYRFKMSRYGKFYGSIDPLVIMEALQEFLRERGEAYSKHEQEQREAKMKEDAKACITWEEYCSLKGIKDKINPLLRIQQYEKGNNQQDEDSQLQGDKDA